MNAPPPELLDPNGATAPPRDPVAQDQGAAAQILQAPTSTLSAHDGPSRHPRPRRPRLAALPPEVRVGHDVSRSTPNAPTLPTARQDLPLRDILQGLGPDMVATACHGINALTATAQAAIEANNLVIRLMAERTVAQEARKWTELAVGRTVNLNQSVKSQRDLPRIGNLSTEKRAQLQSLLTEMTNTDVVDVESVDVDLP